MFRAAKPLAIMSSSPVTRLGWMWVVTPGISSRGSWNQEEREYKSTGSRLFSLSAQIINRFNPETLVHLVMLCRVITQMKIQVHLQDLLKHVDLTMSNA
jgi:hypothetical protein